MRIPQQVWYQVYTCECGSVCTVLYFINLMKEEPTYAVCPNCQVITTLSPYWMPYPRITELERQFDD